MAERLSDALEAVLPALMGIACIMALLIGNAPLMWYLLALMGVCVIADVVSKQRAYRRNGCPDPGCVHDENEEEADV